MSKPKISLETRRSYMGYIFIIPLVLGAILVFIPNILQTLRFSLNEMTMTGTGYELTWTGIKTYKDALTDDPRFTRLALSAIRQLAFNVPVILIFSLFISTLLNQKFHGRVVARIIFFIPVILSTGVIATMDSSVTSMVSNSAVEGTSGEASSAFAEFSTLLYSINFGEGLIDIVVNAVSSIHNIVKSSGMQIFVFLAGLQEIPASLYEAASVEGCSKWELFWKITFPMISPQILINMVYTIADTCSKDNELFRYINEIAFSHNNYALATAMSMIYLVCLSVIIAVTFWVVSKLLKNKV